MDMGSADEALGLWLTASVGYVREPQEAVAAVMGVKPRADVRLSPWAHECAPCGGTEWWCHVIGATVRDDEDDDAARMTLLVSPERDVRGAWSARLLDKRGFRAPLVEGWYDTCAEALAGADNAAYCMLLTDRRLAAD
ncbi:hypothetical protein [Aureimonas populi]|uniref:Uncharacterized protein n=1 Tax=Aureimonas populi TaxID=1701758 RepID=A0ABW5CKW9_9HYPH|nr:hypothetical protein [Aureimonas populi]